MNSNGGNMRREIFRKKFQRSGSLGIPFVPENEIPNIKEYWSFDRSDGSIGDQYRQDSLIVAIPSTKPAKLSSVLQLFEEKELAVTHIETRESKRKPGDLEVLMQFETPANGGTGTNGATREILERLKDQGLEGKEINMTTQEKPAGITNGVIEEDEFFVSTPSIQELIADSPWFPRTIFDLDKSSKRVLMYGTDLDADHPGFKDETYRRRRMMFAHIALNYRHGQPIPRIDYTEEETKTWTTIFKELKELHKKYACKEYLENFVLLEKYCGYGEHAIPQLQDVSKFLKAKTGFQIRPVAGYLSSRDFLAGLAFRVFHCTQYIRHPTDPFYTPEPDCCHELLGHMPLFADPDFAQFSQDIGLASLGASEEDVQKLATLYFFTIEFGLCKQDKQLKIYGAGLLSCIGELKHAVEDNPEIFPFDPDRVIKQEPLITTFQTAYFYTESFEDVQQKIRLFTSHIRRPFVVRCNPYTESVEILNTKRALTLAVNALRSDVNLMASALHKVM